MSDFRKFRFVSPGIFINEIDNSQIPREPEEMGPVIIGRAERGPNMRPVKVDNYSEFVQTFGYPISGQGNQDPWREGNYSSVTHGPYAAEAYLRNGGPVTFVKLAGTDHVDKTGAATVAGWRLPAHNDRFGESVSLADGSTLIGGSAPGAFGLYVAASSSHEVFRNLNFIHAATFYVERGALALIGAETGDGTAFDSSAAGIKAGVNVVMKSAANQVFTIRFYDDSTTGIGGTVDSVTGSSPWDTTPTGLTVDYEFNFNESSDKFIRRKFPTNPVDTNSAIVSATSTSYRDFWMGPSYEQAVRDYLGSDVFASSTAGATVAILLPLQQRGPGVDFGDQRREFTPPQTGWVFSQNTGTSGSLNTALDAVLSGSQSLPTVDLFKFHSLYGGEWEQSNIKISIKDIKKSTSETTKFGTFTVEVRRADDNDRTPTLLEQYNNCNLNPSSPNYIAAKIGDKFTQWDSGERRYKEYNNHPNLSRFIRVQMGGALENQAPNPATLLPFGFYGPAKFVRETIESHVQFSTKSIANPAKASTRYTTDGSAGFVMGDVAQGIMNTTASFVCPSLRLRINNKGFTDPTKAYFGLDTTRSGSNNFVHDGGFADIIRALPGGVDVHAKPTDDAGTVYSFIFTLDDVQLSGSSNTCATYAAGNHSNGVAYTATDSNTYGSLLDKEFNKFTLPLVGGFDGLDITEKNPFRNTVLGASETVDYAYNSIKRAIDIVSDPEVVECNLMTIPGTYKSGLTTHLINTCEARADALAIIDLDGDFKDASENALVESGRKANVTTTVNNLTSRVLNSSYGAAYFPWCSIRDSNSLALVNVPPSVIAMGVLSYSQRNSELWFAPAGFNRGGLNHGAAGLSIHGIKYVLSSKERDKLYDANINPIATFPNEGIVVFGQKTLQMDRSALDRINVRRLMIYLKKEISRMSATLLFDQNVRSTWNRFLAKVEPFLLSVKTRFGLTEFKVVLDTTTTTPELIDRNIMYAKIFLKPARAIEFIALDFIITDSGASFDDL